MQYEHISLEIDEPCAVLTLRRPDTLNAFTYQTLAEIRDAIDRCAADARVIGIIITGQGRAFSAGLDMSVLQATTESESAPESAQSDQLPGIFSYLIEVPKPIIACINGIAAGGGLILALMSDLRFAAEEARLTTVFLKRGLISEHGSSWLLPRMSNISTALDLLWMSEKISATEAKSLGLVDRIYPADELIEAARNYIRRLGETSAPKAIGESKLLVYRHLGMQYEEALRDAEASQNRFVTAADAKEGALSFIEKRLPKFDRIGD